MEQEIDREVALLGITRLQAWRNVQARRVLAQRKRLMVDDFAAKRWESKTAPKDHKPADALRAVLRDIDAGGFDPQHVIIVYATEGENGKVGYYQAGDIGSKFASMGLLTRSLQIMGDS